LENVSPKHATGSGLLAENPLLQKTSEREGLRKVNPILSKLAREHPENPVHLKGGLLGALPTQQQPVKPPNPFAQKDELPKLPKINWGAYDKHRIDGQTRISHDDWARIITGAKDFGGIIPTMVRTVNDGGDGGKANVADVLWRVAQKNPDHARFFQRELTSALGGETIPIRQALMHGEVSPAQLVDPAKSPGLLGSAKPNRFADPDFEKSYWQSAEAYKAEFERKQQTPPATEEPRQGEDVRIVVPQDELTYKRAVFDPAIGDKTTPPDWKKEVLNKQHKDWEMFNRSLDDRHDLGENQKFTLAQIFAAEGGTAKDPAGSASSGILKDTLDDARKRVPGLENVKTPSDLTIDQRVAVMKDYFDRNMSTIGGAKALDVIPSPEAAAAFGDTIYRHGSGDGAKAIQRAIRLVAPERVEADGKMGPETLKAFNEMARDPKTRGALLDALGEQRDVLTLRKESERMSHFTFRSQR
jgi:hypothetical protein